MKTLEERLTALEINVQHLMEDVQEIRKDIQVLLSKFEERMEKNGVQDTSIARLEEKVNQLDKNVSSWSKRFWGLFATAAAAILQGIVNLFIGR